MNNLTWVFLVSDTENLTWVLLLLQIWRILHECSLLQIQIILSECSYCCKYGGSYMSSPLVADMEDRTWVLLVADMEDLTWVLHLLLCLFVFVCLILYVPVNNLSVTSGQVYLGWTSTKQGLMCLAQGHNAVTQMRLKPRALRSWVKHSTTEPLRSHAPLVADMEALTWKFLVADTEDLIWVLLLLQIWRLLHESSLLQIRRILYECTSCCRYGGSYMKIPCCR